MKVISNCAEAHQHSICSGSRFTLSGPTRPWSWTERSHLHSAVPGLHCSSLPLALVAMFCSPEQLCHVLSRLSHRAAGVQLRPLRSYAPKCDLKEKKIQQSVGFTSSSTGKASIEAKKQWIYSSQDIMLSLRGTVQQWEWSQCEGLLSIQVSGKNNKLNRFIAGAKRE